MLPIAMRTNYIAAAIVLSIAILALACPKAAPEPKSPGDDDPAEGETETGEEPQV